MPRDTTGYDGAITQMGRHNRHNKEPIGLLGYLCMLCGRRDGDDIHAERYMDYSFGEGEGEANN